MSQTDSTQTEDALETLAGRGWLSAERDAIEPPRMRWTVEEDGVRLSYILGPTGGALRPLTGGGEGSTSYMTYLAGGGDYLVDTEVDNHDPSGPFRMRVRENGDN